MEKKLLTFELLKQEIQNFQRVPVLTTENPGCSQNCAANIFIDKLLHIIQNGEREKGGNPALIVNTIAIQSPGQKVISNSVVMRKLLGCLDVRSLLQLRQVSRLLTEDATRQLLSPKHEESLCVKFIWNSNLKEFCQKTSPFYEFLDCIKNSQLFPCSRFSFKGGLLSHRKLVTFFADYGSQIQNLKLSPESVNVVALQLILFKWVPNLKSLNIHSNNWSAGENLLNSQTELDQSLNQLLPKLRKLTLPTPEDSSEPVGMHNIYEIMISSPNLAFVEDPHLAYLAQIHEARKFSLIKRVKWSLEPFNRILVQNLDSFAAAGPQLTSLTLEEAANITDPRIIPSLRRLFQSGQNTLDIVHGIQVLGRIFDRNTSIPQLPRVTHVKVEPQHPSPPNILAQGCTLSEILPNLKSMDIVVRALFYPFTSPLNAHEGLKNLKVSNFYSRAKTSTSYYFQSSWFSDLGQLYPNVTHLHIAIHYFYQLGMENVPECLRLIPQHFHELEQLIIEIRTDEHFDSRFQGNMDQALTGLPKDILEQLHSDSEPYPEVQKIELVNRFRNSPSIWDLKKLTKLTFKIHFKQRATPFWSHLTQFYAFQPMKNRQGLVVNVFGNQSVSLEKDELGPL